jgi:hypothetical protein
MVVDKPRERAIVHQGCHNTRISIIIFIASNTWERAIVRHIASNGIEIETLIAWHGDIIISNYFHMINNGGITSITRESEKSI